MQRDSDSRSARLVRVQTIHGPVRGSLVVASNIRTTDFLNMNCHRFLTVNVSEPPENRWQFETGDLHINTESILFVMELKDELPTTDRRVEANRFKRTGVRVRLREFDLQGFMHVPRLSDPMSRLLQNKQPFVAFTSVSVLGPELELAAAFLALNPEHILAVQTILQAEEEPQPVGHLFDELALGT